ncbi:MAG: hypothetical protein WCI31_10510 [Prolixibacteraceae bacterium]
MPQRHKSTKFHKVFWSILIALLSYSAFAQEGSRAFVCDEIYDQNAAGNLYVAIDNLNFFKNNEYKSSYIDGYTLAGMWIRPKLLYYPDKKLRLEIGGEVLAYSGRDDYKLYPWFSVLYKPAKNLAFRMGNLNQDQNHGLAEPVMDSEHYFRDRPEFGIQGKYNNKRIIADLWIDWQKVIIKGDPYKERFVFGTVTDLTLFRNDQRKLSLPISFNGLHEGGEIDDAPGPAQTHIVVSEGLKYEYKTGGTLIKSGVLQGYFLQSTYPLHETTLPGRSGIAFFIQTAMNTDYGTFLSGYWYGNRFFTPLGMPLYQNGAIAQEGSLDKIHMLVFSYRYDRKIFNQSKFGFTSDMFYNPSLNKLSNSAALYLMVNLSFLCRKISN